MGKIIFLNGTSSSGKTTLSRALQGQLKDPYLYFALDQYRDSLPGKYRGLNSPEGTTGKEGLNVVPVLSKNGKTLASIEFGDYGKKVLRGMRQAAATLARGGLNLIIDDIIFDRECLEDYLDSLIGIQVYFIGLFCPLKTLEERESSRLGRFPGTAESQYHACHAHEKYDLKIDTSVISVEESAKKIISLIEFNDPSAFDELRNHTS
tara:strand:- start:139 stop:759 length:621 start_codon:yes stop_codon:yes gene_type:complete